MIGFKTWGVICLLLGLGIGWLVWSGDSGPVGTAQATSPEKRLPAEAGATVAEALPAAGPTETVEPGTRRLAETEASPAGAVSVSPKPQAPKPPPAAAETKTVAKKPVTAAVKPPVVETAQAPARTVPERVEFGTSSETTWEEEQQEATLAVPAPPPAIVVPPGPPRPAGASASATSGPVAQAADETVASAPVSREVSIPSGTVLEVRLSEQISTRTHRTGDRFRVIFESDVEDDRGTLIPQGTIALGRIVEAQEPGRVKGKAALTFELDELQFEDERIPITTNRITMEAEGTKGEDLKRVGVGAAVGTALGAIFGGKKGAVVGGATGAGAGTAGVLLTRGEHVEIPRERLFSFRLEEDLRLLIP